MERIWHNEIDKRVTKIANLLNDKCEVHFYHEGDGHCNCQQRKEEIGKLSLQIGCISIDCYKYKEDE